MGAGSTGPAVHAIAVSLLAAAWLGATGAAPGPSVDAALIKVTAPPKEAGTATLKAGSEIGNYLPKIDRTIRVPTSMMRASWYYGEDGALKGGEGLLPSFARGARGR